MATETTAQNGTTAPPSPPNFIDSVKLKYVKLGYHYLFSHLLTLSLSLLPLIAMIAVHACWLTLDDVRALYLLLQHHHVVVMAVSGIIMIGFTAYIMTRPRPVYLVDYSCYRPPEYLKVSFDDFVERCREIGIFDESSIGFQKKILERSGLGQETYIPAPLRLVPPSRSLTSAKEEAEQEIFAVLDNLFESTKVNPKDIGILGVNCCLSNPVPSLTSMIVNKYKLRNNIKTYNLGGMGCSAGVIAVDLAKDMLQANRNTYAIVVSFENMIQDWYVGNKKSMLLPNCLFRIGCSAVLLSNKPSDKRRAKYKLLHVVRTHLGSVDSAYNCVQLKLDETQIAGVSLSKDLMAVAGAALKANITTLGPLVLPISEQLLFFATVVARKLKHEKLKPDIPDFKLAFDHFCIHAGGKAVIDELEKNLQLKREHVEPSRMTLYRFGNTSSTSIWYELAYTEAKGRMKKGNRVWQISFGSGFKCNSAVWQALRAVKPSETSPWADCIHKFPVEINTV